MAQTHFGFENLDEKEKAERVAGVFSSVAKNYDVMNDLMSVGLHQRLIALQSAREPVDRIGRHEGQQRAEIRPVQPAGQRGAQRCEQRDTPRTGRGTQRRHIRAGANGGHRAGKEDGSRRGDGPRRLGLRCQGIAKQ